MAASLTLGSCALDTTGKILTATISGGTGTGYAITNATGLAPHLSGASSGQPAGQGFGFTIASVSVSGSTLTINLTSPAGSGETVQLDITTGSNLTDSGANTPTGQTNMAVTNSSTVTVTVINPVTTPGKFEMAMNGGALPLRGTYLAGSQYPIEFVADATDVLLYTLSSATATVLVDGATSPTTAPAPNSFWAMKPLATGLAAGKHMFRVNHGDYFYGVRLVGGNRTLDTVATKRQTIRPNGAGQYPSDIPNTSTVALFRGWKDATAVLGTVAAAAAGFTLDTGFTGSGVEIATIVTSGDPGISASVDGAHPGALKSNSPDGTTNNTNAWLPIVQGLTAAAHTLSAFFAGFGPGTTTMMRVINGTSVTSALSAGATTVPVADASTFAVGDWLVLDHGTKREDRQVTAISGNNLTVAALGQAHASGIGIRPTNAAQGAFSTYTHKTYTKVMACMGDSNTQGANSYYPSTPDANGDYFSLYDPRWFCGYIAADPLAIDVVNLGVAGETSTNMVARKAQIGTYGGPGSTVTYDYVTIWAGTNDINSTSTTPATFSSNVQALVTQAKTALKAGGKVLLMPVATPGPGPNSTAATNAGGLNCQTANAQLSAIAAADPTNVIYVSDLQAGLTGTSNSGDWAGVHYAPTGQTKMAANLAPYIGGAAASNVLLGSGFFAAA